MHAAVEIEPVVRREEKRLTLQSVELGVHLYSRRGLRSEPLLRSDILVSVVIVWLAVDLVPFRGLI